MALVKNNMVKHIMHIMSIQGQESQIQPLESGFVMLISRQHCTSDLYCVIVKCIVHSLVHSHSPLYISRGATINHTSPYLIIPFHTETRWPGVYCFESHSYPSRNCTHWAYCIAISHSESLLLADMTMNLTKSYYYNHHLPGLPTSWYHRQGRNTKSCIVRQLTGSRKPSPVMIFILRRTLPRM